MKRSTLKSALLGLCLAITLTSGLKSQECAQDMLVGAAGAGLMFLAVAESQANWKDNDMIDPFGFIPPMLIAGLMTHNWFDIPKISTTNIMTRVASFVATTVLSVCASIKITEKQEQESNKEKEANHA